MKPRRFRSRRQQGRLQSCSGVGGENHRPGRQARSQSARKSATQNQLWPLCHQGCPEGFLRVATPYARQQDFHVRARAGKSLERFGFLLKGKQTSVMGDWPREREPLALPQSVPLLLSRGWRVGFGSWEPSASSVI